MTNFPRFVLTAAAPLSAVVALSAACVVVSPDEGIDSTSAAQMVGPGPAMGSGVCGDRTCDESKGEARKGTSTYCQADCGCGNLQVNPGEECDGILEISVWPEMRDGGFGRQWEPL